jgi:hypothetical protein
MECEDCGGEMTEQTNAWWESGDIVHFHCEHCHGEKTTIVFGR